MAGITLEQAQADLDALRAARLKVLAGQSYTLAGRAMSLANLGEINAAIKDANELVQSLSRSGPRIRRIVPL